MISRGELESHLKSVELLFARARKSGIATVAIILSNDHWSDVTARGELESHYQQLEILMLWQQKVECEFPEGPFFRCALECSDGPIEKNSKVKMHQLMPVPVRVSTISTICLILFEIKTVIYSREKVRKGR